MDVESNHPSHPQPINTWLESLSSRAKSLVETSPAEINALQDKDNAILALLGKLSLHYWRPDFTPSQAKQLYADYLEDLRPFGLGDIAAAVAEYRRDGANQFYPKPGQLIDLIIGKAEVEAKGYTDRFEALQRRRSAALDRGRGELNRVIAQIEGRTESVPAIAYQPPKALPRSRPIASDLPSHPNAKLPPVRE